MDDSKQGDLKDKKILIIYTEMDDWSEEDRLTSALSVEEMMTELAALGFSKV